MFSEPLRGRCTRRPTSRAGACVVAQLLRPSPSPNSSEWRTLPHVARERHPRAVPDGAYGGDPDTARQYLADDLSFQGPAARFSSADAYVRASEHAVRAVKRLVVRKTFVNGSDVAVFYDLHVDHPVGAIAIADCYHLEGDKSPRFALSWIRLRSLHERVAKARWIQCVA